METLLGFNELLGSSQYDTLSYSQGIKPNDALRSFDDRELYFVENMPDRLSPQQFVHGINIYFMHTLNELQNKLPIIYTSPFHEKKYILHSNKLLRIHNTGLEPIEVCNVFTVIPPLCLNANAVRVGSRYLLQTVDYNAFTSDFTSLCIILRIILNSNRNRNALPLDEEEKHRETIALFACDHLRGNKLWDHLLSAVYEEESVASLTEACSLIFNVAEQYWAPSLGLDHLNRLVPTSDTYQSTFLPRDILIKDVCSSIIELDRNVNGSRETEKSSSSSWGKKDMSNLSCNESEDADNSNCRRQSSTISKDRLEMELKLTDDISSLVTLLKRFEPVKIGKVCVVANKDGALPRTMMEVTLYEQAT